MCSNEYTQHTIFIIKRNYPKSSYGIFSLRLKRELDTAMVNEPSLFEPLKFYCSNARRLMQECAVCVF